MSPTFLLWLLMTIVVGSTTTVTSSSPETEIVYSWKLMHRFSDDLRRFSGQNKTWPEGKSKEYYGMLLSGDFKRQKMKIGGQRKKSQLLFPSQGSQTSSFGNDLGWLHYTWIDIGTPNVSFLVALDAGSDLMWVPCDCVQCAPLSARYYTSLDRDLNEYNPGSSSTSKSISCSHRLCELGQNCKSPTQSCPYLVEYESEGTASSGLLVEDVLHLSSSTNDSSSSSVKASVIFGCGKKQSGGYLDGIAPDGLMGLGLGKISVPSLLAKSGLVRDSFSLCFDDSGSGRIFFGDQGLTTHHWTPLLPPDREYSTYVVGVDAFCVGKSSCLEQTSFRALIDSGTSFTFLPVNVYKMVVKEFDRQVNVSRTNYDGYPWEYCYSSSALEPMNYPSVELILSANESFVVQNPILPVMGEEGMLGFCFTIQPTAEDIAIIGQNFMTGYRVVFDRENMKLGWSQTDCEDLSKEESVPPGSSSPTSGKPPGSLPADELGRSGGHAVAPAIAGRAPTTSSGSAALASFWVLLLSLISFHFLRRLEL